jgi:hypothetical protein
MKLDIEALVREANNLANVAIVANPATHEGWDRERMRAFARLIVERCAAECDEVSLQAVTAWKLAYQPQDQGREIGADDCAAAIRQLLEDK